jgi:hypothetical protein
MSEQQFMPQWQYEVQLTEASRMLLTNADKLVSIKIRPIEDIGTWYDRYVSPSEYKEIEKIFVDFQQLAQGFVNYGKARAFRFGDNEEFLFVEHESGPEIILSLDIVQHAALALGAGTLAGRQILKLVNDICKIINKEAHKKNKGEQSDRYYGAKAITIEKRLRTGSKILKQIRVAADTGKDFISKISELM